MRYRSALFTLILATTLPASSTVVSTVAQASTGTYQVSACNFAAEGTNNSWIWSSSDPSSPDHYAKHESCPDRLGSNGGRTDQENGLSTTDALGLSSGAPPGTGAGWRFTAPTGTSIAGVAYERYLGHELDSSNYWVPALRAAGTILPGESCLDTIEDGESCYVGGPPNEGVETKSITGMDAHELNFGIDCEAHTEEECITGATQHSAWAAMYGARVTIADPTPPTLNMPSGALWEPATYTKGTQTVTVSAEDVGGGVKTIELAADGHAIQTYEAPCDYTYAKPCPETSGPQTLTLNTASLADGYHTIALTATDAAGNQSTTADNIDIENDPPPPPTNLTATPIKTGGSTFTATWEDPTGLSSSITSATYQICPIETPAACSTPTTAPATGPATLTVPGGGIWTLSVWLTNAAGNTSPANAAHISITVTPPSSSNPPGTVLSAPPDTDTATAPTATSTSAPPRPKTLRVVRRRVGRRLIVEITGITSGRIRVKLQARLHGRVILSTVKNVEIKWGHATVDFRLSSHLPKHAALKVTAVVRA